jgi:hypothetical protein
LLYAVHRRVHALLQLLIHVSVLNKSAAGS